jgi:crossover junction endodeoxyribonuclease RusA
VGVSDRREANRMSEARTVVLDLGFPPSTNNLFATHGNRRRLSEAYIKWRTENGWRLMTQKPASIKGLVNIRIDLVAPDRRHRDCDNRAKAPIDLLVAHGVIEGDDSRFVKRISIGWEDSGEPCRVMVTAVEPKQENG